MLIHLPPARKGAGIAPDRKVEDATDDDPSVWEFYHAGLATSWQELATVDVDSETAEVEMQTFAANIDAWIENIESDSRMRRADVVAVASAMGLSPSASAGRAATIAAMRERLRDRLFQMSKSRLNGNVTPW